MYLKKTLEMIGLAILICFSFFLTEKTNSIMKNNDDLMTTVKEKSLTLNVDSKDAIVNGDTIIPGICGKEIDLNKSYNAMKKVGFYNPSLLVYNELVPSISVNKQYDKYIVGGNPDKKEITFIFKIQDKDNVEDVINILEHYNLSTNLFIEGSWLEENINKLEVISSNNIIGSLGYNGSYKKSDNYWLESTIKKKSHQSNYYCYTEKKDDDTLKECSKNNNYTIIPKTVISTNLLLNIKKSLENGIIIAIDINNNTVLELPNAIEYVKSKGLKIVNLDVLLKE